MSRALGGVHVELKLGIDDFAWVLWEYKVSKGNATETAQEII